MPLYEYQCPMCGWSSTEYFPMDKADSQPACAECGSSMKRDYGLEAAGPHLDRPFTHPIELHSLAPATDEEIAEFRHRHPDVEFQNGAPIARTRSEKLKIMRKEGYEEKN